MVGPLLTSRQRATLASTEMIYRTLPNVRVLTLLTAVLCGVGNHSQTRSWAADEAVDGDSTGGVIPAEYLRSPKLPGHSRSPIYGRDFAVTSGQPAATSVGMKIFRSGGNAADAAVAMALALSVVEPMRSGPGGDVSILYWDEKSKRLFGLESAGLAPRELAALLTAREAPQSTDGVKTDPEATQDVKSVAGSVPKSGPLTWTIPGAVDGWFALHSRFGSMPWDELCAPAVNLATNGFVLSPVVADDWNQAVARLSGLGAVALKPSEAPLAAGTVVVNADYARTLETLASDGRDSFYEGDLGQTLVAFGRGLDAALSLDDLAKHQATWHEPASVEYRDTTVATLPVSRTGVSVLETLGLLAAYDLREMGRGSAQFWHLLLEAKRLSITDVMTATTPGPGELLTAEHLAMKRREIDPNQATESTVYSFNAPMTHASSLVVTDAAGNTCILVQDLGHPFGSGIVPGAMGFVMQGRAAGLAADQLGGRLLHGRTLATVSRAGQPFAFTTSDGATELMVQSVASLVDFEFDPQTVVDAARLIEFETGGERQIVAEPGIANDAIDKLRSRGHVVIRPTMENRSTDMGEVHLIVRPISDTKQAGKSVISAGSDPRRDGSSLAE